MNESEIRGEIQTKIDTVVVKVGSRLLTRDGKVDLDQIRTLAGQLAKLMEQGRKVCLVSSGAVGTAMTLLDLDRPKGLGDLQAFAAIGQAELIHHYNRAFERFGKRAAQVLLTMEDLGHRKRYLNLRNTIFSLFELQTIPIINENDCVATEEIAVTFGDNDRLAANVAMLVDADLLIILSDVKALYDRDPIQGDAQPISFVGDVDDSVLGTAKVSKQEGRSFSKGGMLSKLQAAKLATSAGIPTLIAGGREEDVLTTIFAGEQVGTLVAANRPINLRRRWIKSAGSSSGCITIDPGAVRAIREQGRSLLPIGVTEVNGEFEAGDLVEVVDGTGQVVAKGISNFSKEEAVIVAGKKTEEIVAGLERITNEEMIHRDNLALE